MTIIEMSRCLFLLEKAMSKKL
uniref:Uncharacterized protein n=1 Tax=Rhizophora mucronata TaxID=61149 RepID=A0A2P2NN88_RHIMU